MYVGGREIRLRKTVPQRVEIEKALDSFFTAEFESLQFGYQHKCYRQLSVSGKTVDTRSKEHGKILRFL